MFVLNGGFNVAARCPWSNISGFLCGSRVAREAAKPSVNHTIVFPISIPPSRIESHREISCRISSPRPGSALNGGVASPGNTISGF